MKRNPPAEWNLRVALLALFLSGLVFSGCFAVKMILKVTGWLDIVTTVLVLISAVVFGWLGVEIFSRKKHVLIDERTEELLIKTAGQCFFGLIIIMLLASLILEYTLLGQALVPSFFLALIPVLALLVYFLLFIWNDYRGE